MAALDYGTDLTMQVLIDWRPEEKAGEYKRLLATDQRKGVGAGTLFHMAKLNGWEPPAPNKDPQRFTDEATGVTKTLDEWLHLAIVALAARDGNSDQVNRAGLGIMEALRRADDVEKFISSRHLADLSGVSHERTQHAIRFLCPKLMRAYQKGREKDLQKAQELLVQVEQCIDGAEALSLLNKQQRKTIDERMRKPNAGEPLRGNRHILSQQGRAH